MRTPHLNGLRAFETALRTRNLAAAGRELGVTAAAVGQQIRNLENYLGRRLFERRPNGVIPTAAALQVQDRLTAGMSILSEVVVQLSCAPDRVAVTLPESFAENWLALRISDFYRTNAGVDLRLDSTNRQVDLFQEDFDFAIRYAASPEKYLASVRLFEDFVLPVCSPEFAEKYGLMPDRCELDDVPLIHLADRTPDPGWVDWTRWADNFGINIDDKQRGPTFLRFNSGMRAAVAGQGLVLCGIVESFHALRSGELIAPFGYGRTCQTSFRYWLVFVRDRQLSKVQRKFVTWIEEIAAAFRKDLSLHLSQHFEIGSKNTRPVRAADNCPG